MAYLLYALGCDGVTTGTSDVGKQSLGWEATTSATALAVATICIPAVDYFFNSKRVVHWWERVRSGAGGKLLVYQRDYRNEYLVAS